MSDRLTLSHLPTRVVIVTEGIPPSGKNKRRNYGNISLPSKEAETYAKRLQALVRAKLLESGLVPEKETLFGSGNLAMDLEVDEERRRTRITVHWLGPKPKQGRLNRRRDIQNTVDVPCDALQGILYDDDRAMRWVRPTYADVDEDETVRFEDGD